MMDWNERDFPEDLRGMAERLSAARVAPSDLELDELRRRVRSCGQPVRQSSRRTRFAARMRANVATILTTSALTVALGLGLAITGPAALAALAQYGLNTTATSVTCSPSTISAGQQSTCTATVTDTASTGQSAPTGTVSFTSQSSGGSLIGGGTCTLSPTSGSSASCQATYTTSASGSTTQTVTASYGGDSSHASSSGTGTIHVAFELAFGDSIAAGYGLGPSGPTTGGSSTNNAYAYPAVLSHDVGLAQENFAVEGETAGPIGRNPSQTDVLGQICASAGTSLNMSSSQPGCIAPVAPVAPLPRFITITVGADDIDFAGCMINVLESGLSRTTPCAGSTLTTSLKVLQQNVQLDLSLIHGYYPGVPVVLTGYYNPLGSNGGHFLLPPDCSLVTAAVAVPLTLQKHWRALFNYVLDLYVRASNNIPGPPPENVVTDAILSAFSRQVLQRLNNTLANTAAGQANVSFAPLDIGNQGLCSSSPLVFQPQVQASYVLKIPFQSQATVPFNFGLENTCPGPKDPFENMFTKSGAGTVSLIAGVVLDYSFSVSPNCVPHPTVAGQARIATQVLPFVPP